MFKKFVVVAALVATCFLMTGCAHYATRNGVITPLGAMTPSSQVVSGRPVIAQYSIIFGVFTSGYADFVNATDGKEIDIVDVNFLNIVRVVKAVRQVSKPKSEAPCFSTNNSSALTANSQQTVSTPKSEAPRSSTNNNSALTASSQQTVFVDKRDRQTYKTVQIGSQMWMAENLNYNASGSKCYNNNSANCDKYGRLYNWITAQKACPAGWHLPSEDEWITLESHVGGSSATGTKLKSSTDWNSSGGVPTGTDNYGFSALPGGYGSSRGGFNGAGYDGYWWGATARHRASVAWSRRMYYDNEHVERGNDAKTNLFSVRCLQN